VSGLTLYTYFRSSCAYRVRLALALKGLAYEPRYVHLRRDGGQNWKPEYRRLNPQGLVPALTEGQAVLTQSLAIIEYLEECHPDPRLLPAEARERAYVRALAQLVACDIQPLDNLRVLDYLKQELEAGERQTQSWYRHWVDEGLQAFETLLVGHPYAGRCCYGDQPTLADICLVPQVYNAIRYHCDLEPYPTVRRIHAYCDALPAFRQAAPENQADAE
jgi:maleylpyruvate isomerase